MTLLEDLCFSEEDPHRVIQRGRVHVLRSRTSRHNFVSRTTFIVERMRMDLNEAASSFQQLRSMAVVV